MGDERITARPGLTGKVYITMESTVTGKRHLSALKNKTGSAWVSLDVPDISVPLSGCWAFSRSGAKRIIERLQAKDYRLNYEKGLLKFGTIEQGAARG